MAQQEENFAKQGYRRPSRRSLSPLGRNNNRRPSPEGMRRQVVINDQI